jgi:hypothetical protein
MRRRNEDSLYDDEIFSNSYANSWFSQYLLTLGEFNIDSYTKAADQFSGVEWYFFIAATLFG